MEIIKFQIYNHTDEDYCQKQKVVLDGGCVFEARDLAMDCPEDATISRDLFSASQYRDAVMLGYALGAKKVVLEWENIEGDF